MDDGNAMLALAEVVAMLALIATIWFGLLHLLARIGGWSRLARHYRTFESFAGEAIRFQFGYVGYVRYKGALTFGADAKGLYLAMFALLRPGHPPLVVPWGQLEAERIGKDRVALRFKQVPGVVLKITRRLAQRVLAGRGLLPEEST